LTRKSKIVRIGRGSSSGIDLNRFNPSNIDDNHLSELQRKLYIHDEDFIIGYAGRLTKDKGIVLLIESFRKLYEVNSDLQLLLIAFVINSALWIYLSCRPSAKGFKMSVSRLRVWGCP